MGILDFFKRDAPVPLEQDDATIYQQIVNEALAHPKSSYFFDAFDKLPTYIALTKAGTERKTQFLLGCFSLMPRNEERHHNNVELGFRLVGKLVNDLPLSDDKLHKVGEGIKHLHQTYRHSFWSLYEAVLPKIVKAIKKSGLSTSLEKALQCLVVPKENTDYRDSKFNETIYTLLQSNSDLEVNKHDAWGTAAKAYLEQLNPEQRLSWRSLFKLSKQAAGKSEPSAKWLKEARPLIEAIGADEFSRVMIEWLSLLKTKLQEIHKSKDYRVDFLRNENHDAIKGLIWCTGLINNNNLNIALDDYATWAYKKKPGVGAISVKTGTACMCAFAMLPIKDGVSRLSKFRSKIKNNSILKAVDKFIRIAAEKNGVAIDQIQELSVPDFNITSGYIHQPMGDYVASYAVEDGVLQWLKGDKIQKSVPLEVKENFKNELKALKNTAKEIDSLISVIKDRLEHSYLDQRTWNFTSWSELFLDHPLTSIVARKLIWHFYDGDKKTQGIWNGHAIIDVLENEITWLSNTTSVQLWHPIGFSIDDILLWRNYLQQKSIVQPFKQAYREVYLLTDAEVRTESYSNRFAAHILRQHQFAALCRQRGWHYTLMGNWDSHNTPYITLRSWQMEAQFLVNAEWQGAETNATGIFNYITTDQVRFSRNGVALLMIDVPALVFSEIMRDVDLFVGVTSLGNDPTWRDGGDAFMNTYWHNYSFSELTESAVIRSQVLQNIVPKLKIAPQCRFDKKFLIVEGKVRTYKIHMGSGNILMEPNDQYLCIVPDGSKQTKSTVFLPFEGDNLLSIIISKALLLADDDKIKDSTILSQINRR